MGEIIGNVALGIYLIWLLFTAVCSAYVFGKEGSKTQLGFTGGVLGVFFGLCVTAGAHWLLVIFASVVATMGETFGQWVLDDFHRFTEMAFGR